MSLRSHLMELGAYALGSRTESLHRLHQRRRFQEFKRRWRDIPLLDFPYERRDVLYRHVRDQHLGDVPIDYLEFGCWQGESLRLWCGLNAHAGSRFWGFDSFEGLPEDWDKLAPKGTFSEGGKLPRIDDARVKFVKGWFQDTLPDFVNGYSRAGRQVLHLDADLFSATLYVLITLNPPAGTVLLFDEFSDSMHEFRAFEDFVCACNRDYRVLAARRDFHKLAVELL